MAVEYLNMYTIINIQHNFTQDFFLFMFFVISLNIINIISLGDSISWLSHHLYFYSFIYVYLVLFVIITVCLFIYLHFCIHLYILI